MKPLCSHCGTRKAWIDGEICGTCYKKLRQQEMEQVPEPIFDPLTCRSCHSNPVDSEGLCEDCLQKSRVTVRRRRLCAVCKKRRAKVNDYCHRCYTDSLSGNTAAGL